MKFVTIVVILLLQLPAVAQLKVSIYGHLTQVTNIGMLSLDGNVAFTESPISAATGNGPVYRATVTTVPPFALYRNNTGISGIGATAVYPVGGPDGTLRFYGEVRSTGYFAIRYVYQMSAPNAVTSNMDGATQTCANVPVILRSMDNWPLFADAIVTPGVVWEYEMNGSNTWRAFDSSSASYTLSFVPVFKLPVGSVTNFRFRCRTKAKYADRVYYSPYSDPSDFYTIIPSPPALADVNAIEIRPACAGMNNGRIHIPGQAIGSSFALMRWMLRPGNVTGPCDNNCGDIIDWSNGADSVSKGVDIYNIPPGTYTLWLMNPGGMAGNCLSAIKVTIPEVAALGIQLVTRTNINCYGADNGIIIFNGKGGGGYRYQLRVPTGQVLEHPDGVYAWLKPGDYLAMVTDTVCGSTATMSLTLTAPPPLSLGVTAISPVCSVADGSILVASTGSTISLYRDTMLIPVFAGLDAGRYTVRVADVCSSKDTVVVLEEAIPLSLRLLHNDTISCFGAHTGHLVVAGSGGMGRYRYTIAGNVTHTNRTGDFDDLPAGDYTVQVRNDTLECDDVVTQQYSVYQKAPVQLQVATTTITCHNADNGSLQAIVTGGPGGYTYSWEMLEQHGWMATDPQIDELGPGTYIVRIGSDCPVIVDTVELVNPAPLTIESVKLQEAKCLEEGAVFDIVAAGGDGQYTYALSGDHGEMYIENTTVHTAGVYDIRVTDGQGCMAWAPDSYIVSLPDTLRLTTDIKHITCKGNNDGYVNIRANGGAGDYTYAMIHSPGQTSPLFDSLFAGDYTLFVMDERGCSKSATVRLSEDSSGVQLGVSAATVRDVYCATDQTGIISLATAGGKSPYTYSLDNSHWQAAPAFSGLPAGDYVVRVKDSEGCRARYEVTVGSQDSAIILSSRITPVRCFGEASGMVEVNVTGGDGLFTYHWDQPPRQARAGTYQLTVTDGKGCTFFAAYEVPEPPLLAMQVDQSPTCDGLAEGQLMIHAEGGMAGYTYAVNYEWQEMPVFNQLAAGTYMVAVKDGNGCIVQSDVNITAKNTKPEVNFLIVSQDQVTDTIAVREICLPAPDVVAWAYPSSARYLGEDMFGAPQLRFNQAGDYWVQLSATFGSCTYTLTKELRILPYDPENLPVYQLPAGIISTVSLAPNPNNGHFRFTIRLHTKQQVLVFVYDLNGRLITRKQYDPSLLVEDALELSNVMPGIYLLRVLTEHDSRDVPFVISQY